MIGNDALAILLERTNAAWWVLDICLLLYLGYYLWSSRRGFSWHWLWRHVEVPLHLQAAIAIWMFTLGDFGVRFIIWWVRHAANDAPTHYVRVPMTTTIPLAIFAFVAAWGIICKLRTFSSPWLGQWVWISSTVLALIAAAATRMIR